MRSLTRLLGLLAVTSILSVEARASQILLIAGKPSHNPGQHEHNAGVLLLKKWLNQVPGVHVTAFLNGAWPDDSAVENADAIFVSCDGAEGHLAFQGDRAAAISKAAAHGTGLMFYHFAVEPPAQRGHPEMLNWIGAYFELNYSVNPAWEADILSLPQHQVTRGVKPFKILDEWYYNMRLANNLRGFTPILIATPPPDTLSRPDGERSGNPDVRSKIGQPQCLAWVWERPEGGRGAGFCGGHYHRNLGDDNFRKVILNTLLWIAKVDIPPNGIEVTVTPVELKENWDPKAQAAK